MNNIPPASPPEPHVCFSGSTSCSGCNPCEPCKLHVMQCVLPVAMVAGGFNKDAVQSERFFAGYHAGWQRLHDAMMQDPQLRTQYVARELAPVPPPQHVPPFGPGMGAVQQQTYPMSPDPVQETLNAAQQPGAGHPVAPQRQDLGLTEEDLQKPMDQGVFKTMLEDAERRAVGGVGSGGVAGPPVVEPIANPRQRSMTSPTRSLDAEQIASAVAPVVIGDVMNVPK